MNRRRVALVGAGNIAETHAPVLQALSTVELAAVVDENIERAQAFADRWKIPRVLADPEALLTDRDADAVHVLVPPPAHRAVAEPLLRAGIDVLIEKPLATSAEDCDVLVAAAEAGEAALAVNHNNVHHPAQVAARRIVTSGEIGEVRHVAMRFSMPLHQLATRQLGHWMFDQPKNLLLEQAVHPLSQIEDFLGPTSQVVAVAGPPLSIGSGVDLQPTWLISLVCARGTAQLVYSLGEDYPSWGATVVGRDGAVHADYVANRVWREEARKWIEPLNHFQAGMSGAADFTWQSVRNLADYIGSTLKLRGRSDPFFLSMQGSIRSFHRALGKHRRALDGADGRRVVALCERIAAAASERTAAAVPASPRMLAMPASTSLAVGTDGNGCACTPLEPSGGSSVERRGARPRLPSRADVLVVGGTGFIGRPLVFTMAQKGLKVAVLSRNPRNLPDIFQSDQVTVHRGNVTRGEDVALALSGARSVVNLAHAGGATAWPEIKRALVGGALTLARVCLDKKAERLVHVSSIAALYLGEDAIVTGNTPPDPLSGCREPYSRAKVMVEQELLRLHREQALPVCILRPGVVIGEGGPAFHSGIGFYNTERHCLGWNRGRNPLPLVLVADVADAIVQALDAPNVAGRCYNLVGDVRLTAREYVGELGRALRRPLRYHPQSVPKLYAVELGKWVVKRAVGRSDPPPSRRDLRSRGLVGTFDCSEAKRDLGWRPVSSRAAFIRDGIEVHARR